MKSVFLIIDYVPHQIVSIKTLIEKYNYNVLAFHVGKLQNNLPHNLQNFSTKQYQSLSKEEILNEIKLYEPDIVVTAGWMISEYNWVCKELRKTVDIPIVAMSDTPWYGTWRQKINTLISPFHVKKAFTHLWVSGIRQYDYARKLGFSNNQIIFNSLSADTETFNKVSTEKKQSFYPKNFLFIGRFTSVKGLSNLMKAWSEIQDKKGWTFTLIGQGEMEKELIESKDFIVKDYMSQSNLIKEMENSGCFVLPSLQEPWALVIHEAAIAGLPIICTETCGAAPHFVINNYNGFRIKNNSVEDLKNKLVAIINLKEQELYGFSLNSRKLSKSISPEIQTASLMQVLHEK